VSESSPRSPGGRKRRPTAPRAPRASAELLEPAEAAYVLNLSVPTLARWRMTGIGPRFVRPAPRVVRYRRADLEQWIGSSVRSTSEADARARGAA
jgi:predicted DNA-binding transcriptional regulator AlpA